MAIQIVPPQDNAEPETALVAFQGGLPSINSVRQRMAWMTEMHKLLTEYVQQNMDPSRHFYTFSGSAYVRIKDQAQIQALLKEGKKPALNQDGIHNLMALYECDVEDQRIEEFREDGFYTCRVTLKMRYFGSRVVIGTGSCTTRESKYAYRWVYEREVPKGTDKATLKQKTFSGDRGDYQKYRLDNEDIADVEATVLQMAIKRAKSSGVKELPGVSEVFSTVGDPDEGKREEDAERQELLVPLEKWAKSLKPVVRAKAILAVFSEPLRGYDDIAKLESDRLTHALQVIRIAIAAKIDWASGTLMDDLKKALQASAQKAKTDLYGDSGPGQASQTTREATTMGKEPRSGSPTPAGPPPEARRTLDDPDEFTGHIDLETGELFDAEASAAVDREQAERDRRVEEE